MSTANQPAYGHYPSYGHQAGDQSYGPGPSGQHSQQQSTQTSYGSFQPPPTHSSAGYNTAATTDSSYSSHSYSSNSYGSNSYPSSGTYTYPEEGSAYNSRTTK